MTWAMLAVGKRVRRDGSGKFPVWVEVMMSPFGIFTLTPGWVVATFFVTSWVVAKWPVAPVSKTKVEGEGDSVYADSVFFSLLLLLLSPSRICQVVSGFPTWLPPMLSSCVALSLWPGFFFLQVMLE